MTGGGIAPGVVASNELWIESDRAHDAARSLDLVNAHLVSAAVDPYAWAWVVLSVRQAASAFIRACSEVEPVVTISSPLPGLRVRGGDAPPDGGAGDDLVAAYRQVASASGLDAFPAVAEGLERITRIHERIHDRRPGGWALRLNDLPRTTRSCLKLCEQLGWSPGRVRWSDPRVASQARARYVGSVRILEALDGEYNGA